MIDGPRRSARRARGARSRESALVAPGLEILTGATWALAVASPLLARDRAAGARPLAALAATFLVLEHLTTALTGNQPETLGGLLAPALLAALAALGRTGRPRLARVMTTLVLAGLVVSLVRFDREVIRTRRGIDIRWTEADESRPPLTTPEALSGLRWKTPELYHWDAAGLETLRAELAAAEGTFWYLGDLGLIHALAGRRPPTTMLWYHPGFTLPDADDPSREAWEDGLVEALRDAGVRRLVIEGEATWMGESWRRFPRVAERLGPGASPARVVGGFVVIEIAAR
ncbi:MAG: hypothetical protein R3F20_18370 [Planctomycetota bacterium]